LLAQIFRKLPQTILIKIARPMTGDRILITHKEKVVAEKGKAKG
jgi:hypothetical protein